MKKILIAFVFVCLLCALFSVSAFATETDAAAVANTESTKTVIKVADVTNADEGLYTLADAIAYAKNEGISEYTLKLTEDINVDEQIVIGTKVDMTVDLCGYTLSSSVDLLKLGTGTDKSTFSFVTSSENGKIYSKSKSLVQLTKNEYTHTFNLGSADTEPLTVEVNMIVTAGSGFRQTSVANINIYGGSCKLVNGFYQASSTESAKLSAVYNVSVKDADIILSNRLMYVNNTYVVLNSDSTFVFEGCSVKSVSDDKYFPIVNKKDGTVFTYAGIIKITDCDLTRFKFDNSSEEAKSIVFGEGCTFTDCLNVFNTAKNGFSQTNASCDTGCVIANADDGVVRIVKENEAGRVEFVTPIDTEIGYWMEGSTPIYSGELSMIIGDSEYSFTFPSIEPATLGGASYEGKISGGPQLSYNLTLHESIDFNIYVPEVSEIVAINGRLLADCETKDIDGVKHYKVSFSDIAPKDAPKTQIVRITVNYNGEDIEVERPISIAEYAAKLVATTMDTNASNLTVALMAYIKAASEYFGTATEQTNAALDAVINRHAVHKWSSEGKEIFKIPSDLTSIKGAALNLDNMPGFVVYVAKGVESVTVDGSAYTVNPKNVVIDGGEELCYVVVPKSAFDMLEPFDICVGDEVVRYNLDTYIYYMNNPSYADALYGYALMAKTYAHEPITRKEKTPLSTEKTYSVLFVGNSFTHTNGMPTIFGNVAASAGYTVEVTTLTHGGSRLEWFVQTGLDEDYTAEFDEYLTARKYDYVIIQSSSTVPLDSKASFYDAVRIAVKKIREVGAEPILYATPARELTSTVLINRGWSHEDMLYRMAAVYSAIGEELGVTVCYPGFALAEVYLNTDLRVFIEGDNISHPDKPGAYGIALTIFGEIFGVDPLYNTYDYSVMTAEEEAIVKRAASMAVFYTPHIPKEFVTSSVGVTLLPDSDAEEN